MQKCLIFLTMLFSVSVWAGLDWNPYVMTHERFVHLSAEEKEQVIIKTMEAIVEMEGKYRKAVVQNQTKLELYEKYMVLVKKLHDILINEAYAGPSDSIVHKKFIQRAGAFTALLNELKEDACIYAGYVSKLVNGRCTNPALLNGKKGTTDERIKAAYLNVSNENGSAPGKCGGTTRISCNPVIFGYKQNANGVPFCVKTSPNEAHNAAYECMKLALTPNKKTSLTDAFETRKTKLADAMVSSASAFKNVHGFIFKTCVCGGTGLNEVYTEYMRPHRTCFGMLNTLRAIGSECSPLTSQTAVDAFSGQWNNYFGSNTGFEKQIATKEVPFDRVYKDALSKLEKSNLCSEAPANDDDDKESTECSTECKKEKDKDGKESVFCTVSSITVKKKVDGKIVTSEVKEFKEVKLLLEAGKTQLTYEGEDGQKYVCDDLKADDDDEEEQLGCSLTKSDDKANPVVTLTFTGLKKDQKEPKITWSGADGAVDAKDPKIFNAKATSEKKTLIATLTVEGAAPAAATATATTDKDKAGTTAAAADPISCPADIGGDDGGAKYTIKTEMDPPGPAEITVKVKAVVKASVGKMPDNYMIVWVRTGYKGPEEAPKKPETSVRAPDAGAEVSPPAATEPPKHEVPEKAGTPESTIDEPRVQTKYDACAELRDDKNKVVDTSCQTVPPLAGPKPNYGPVAPPPAFTTPAYNTRTMGVQ